MEGVRWADLWLNAERVIWVVDHPVRDGWARRQREGEVVTPGDQRWRGDAHERVIPGCARSWCRNAAINGRLHNISKVQTRHRRIARQHASDRYRYQLSNGRMAKLADDSALLGEPWLVVSELRFDNKDSLILRAAPVDESRLRDDFAQRFVEEDIVRWDDTARALIARRETRFDQILLLP